MTRNLKYYLMSLKQQKRKSKLTIIIPAYNEAAYIGDCLESLLSQESVRPFEIIVVDNNSDDSTAEIAKSIGVRVIKEIQPGVCAARQAGLEHATGNVIVSTDADCTYPPDWLKKIQDIFDDQPDLGLLIGTYRFPVQQRGLNFLLLLWEALSIRISNAFGRHLYVSASNLVFRKELFVGYDSALTQGGDELYVLSKLKSQGRVMFKPDNPVTTSERRLKQGFLNVLLGDFFIKYLVNYALASRFKHRAMDTYKLRSNISMPSLWKRSQLVITYLAIVILLILLSTAVTYGLYTLLLGANYITWLGLLLLLSGFAAYVTFAGRSQFIMPAAYRVYTKRKLLALTFDDGPNPPYTQQIAKIIESYGGKASFFICGTNASKYPKEVKRLAVRGHTIGNHTYSHSFINMWRPKSLMREIKMTSDLITSLDSKPVIFFRSPWLTKNPIAAYIVKQQGLRPVSGRFMSYTEILQPDGQKMADKKLTRIKPGSIIILHDSRELHGGDRRQTVKAVEVLCSRLHEQGYTFVPLSAVL